MIELFAAPRDIPKARRLIDVLDLELTERCNQNCIHCGINRPARDPAARQAELTTAEWQAILREAAALGALTVRLTGGEPLLRPDFEELYLFARTLGLKVILFTNATLMTPRIADLLSRVPPLERIEVSVYGLRRESYEAVTRTKGSFAAFQEGLGLLLSRRVPFAVKSARLAPNQHEMAELAAYAAALPWAQPPPPYLVFFNLRGRRDSASKNRMIRRLRPSPGEALALLTRDREAYVRAMKKYCAAFMRPEGDRLFSCAAGCRSGCVDAYGNLQLCMLLRHPETVFCLRRGSLEEGLSALFPRVRSMRTQRRRYLDRCAGCFLKGLCEQCPAKSWSEHGTLDTPVEYLCRLAHVQAQALGLIREGEKAWEVKDGARRVRSLAEGSP